MNGLLHILSFLLLVTSVIPTYATGVKGYIRDSAGEPLEFATIFVQENGTGTVSNTDGYYELRLDPGSYTLVFQYLGYESQVKQVQIGDRFRELNIELKQQALELKTVDVIEGQEDGAYTVMRKAIAKAGYHRQQLDAYRAQVYIKGSGRVKDAPFFLRKTLEKEGVDPNTAFASESVSIIEYERPSTFRERVISIYSQGENNDSGPNSFINGSFYEPEIAEAISPLSPKAFAYYRFKLDGFFVDRGFGVNRIQVIPRSRGENVFEGTIFIVEDLWAIHSLSLQTYKFGFSFLVNQVYAPIQDKVWLPVSHRFDVEGKILGFDLEYKYLATVSDYEITLNPDLDLEFDVIDEKLNKDLARQLSEQAREQPRTAAAEEKLAQGQELTRKDLRRLLRDYEKQERQEEPEPEVVMNTEYKVDSLARRRDSTYWAEIRPVPLTPMEVRGYSVADSISRAEQEQASETSSDNLNQIRRKSKRGAVAPSDLILGGNYQLSKKQRIIYESPLVHGNFNPVEGFNLHTNVSYVVRGDNTFRLGYTPRYAFARRKLILKAQSEYTFGPKDTRSKLKLAGGTDIRQFNEDRPINELLSTFANLLSERSYMRIFEKKFVNFSWDQELADAWSVSGQIEWANRRTLENQTTQVWFNKENRTYAPNIPVNEEVEYPLPEREQALFFTLGIDARPWQKYRIRNGNRYAIPNSSPRVQLQYRKGLPGLLDSEVNYDRLSLTVQHKWRAGARGTIDARLHTGLFLNNEQVGFTDYQHFQGNQLVFTASDPVGSYRLLEYYRHSTRDEFLGLNVHYQFRKLLFTQIPEVWLLGIKENLFVNYLTTPTSQNYTEIGYSLDNIFRVFRLEAVVSFQDGKYQDFGILVGVASNIGNISID